MSSNRQNAFKRNLLVKQRSCFETMSASHPVRSSSGISEKKFLQKKLSMDSDSNNNAIANYGGNHNNASTWAQLNLHPTSTSPMSMDHQAPEHSLRIGNAIKKRSQQPPPSSASSHYHQHQSLSGAGGAVSAANKNENDPNDRSKKTMKAKDSSRLNINIFLAQNATIQDGDASDSETSIPPLDSGVVVGHNSGILEKGKGENPPTQATAQSAGSAAIPKSALSGAAARRAQFQSSRGTETVTSVERERPRPPLVRAMSAPIRPLEDSVKQMQNKRRSRRRRNFRERDDILEIDEDEALDGGGTHNGSSKSNRNRKPQPPRTRSALGCDIETLVSLLSSGGSDSEKEESSPKKTELPKVRTPMLRKTVSFQENDTVSPTPTKDLSTIYRRGSVAPLAAKIRANRPPTAPPGSIFLKDFQKSENKVTATTKPLNSATSMTKLGDDSNEVDPENRTPKERECWRLFQKMTAMGLVVSYDTILRGMLTPTELRMLQKQKDIESARQESLEKENELSRNSSLEKENVKKEENKT